MSYVLVAPEVVADAAGNLAGIGSSITEANAAAAAPTTGVMAAAGDEVSAAIASLFSGHAQEFQALSAQAAAFHAQFVQALSGAGGAYASAEAANASPLQTLEQVVQTLEQDLLGVINAPTNALFHRPLIGNGANGTATNPNGGAGGFLLGNGGNGEPGTPRTRTVATAGMPGCWAMAVPAGRATPTPTAPAATAATAVTAAGTTATAGPAGPAATA